MPGHGYKSFVFTAPVCDRTLSYATLEDLSAAAGSYPDICTDYYALGTLNSLLDAALVNYTAANAGYDVSDPFLLRNRKQRVLGIWVIY